MLKKLKYEIYIFLSIFMASQMAIADFVVGSGQFKRYHKFAEEGFRPVAVSNVGKAMVGMSKDEDLYFCFSLNDEKKQKERLAAILNYSLNKADVVEISNIPLVCVLAEQFIF